MVLFDNKVHLTDSISLLYNKICDLGRLVYSQIGTEIARFTLNINTSYATKENAIVWQVHLRNWTGLNKFYISFLRNVLRNVLYYDIL